MQPWHKICVPHRDIREGRFDESVFAADLSDVVADRGPLEYRDAQTFFKKTYPTLGLVNLLSAILSRLSGQGKGEAVIHIQTPFGGGKTHSLIALYHLFRHGEELKAMDAVQEVMKRAKVRQVPQTKVATFVGTAADALKGKTPWGVLAEKLERYPLLQDHDQKRRAPGKDLLHEIIGDAPTLILMDEIGAYAVTARDFLDQLMVFFQQLTEAVKVLPQCSMVVTLPSSAPYGEEGERALSQLQRIFHRVETIYTPVEGEEIYEILRRRLFEDQPDPAQARKVAESYWDMYQRLGDDVPREVRQPAYRERMRKAYPFHPELIDLLFERWSTFPNFQRTRGVLRLLAEVVADLYQREYPAPLIQPAQLNFLKPSIRRELIKHIGNEFEGVIASDIADGNAKAQKIDREMGTEYARFGIASGLATSIFFSSFSGGERKGVGVQRLRISLLREGIPPAMVGDALRRLEEELWFLHVEGGVYSFSNQPNLNRVRVEKEEAVGKDLIADEIRSRLTKAAGSELRVTLWPKESPDVPDSKELKLAVLSWEYPKEDGTTKALVEDLLNKCGSTFRTNKNTLLILAPAASEFAALRRNVKKLLAERAIRDDKTLMRQMSEENKKSVENKIKDLEGGIPFSLLTTYRNLAKTGESGVMWLDLGLPTAGERGSLAKRVRQYLKGEELLLEKISPANLLKKTLREDETEKPLGDIANAFLKYPQLPMLESAEVVKSAIAQGVREGIFGVKVGDRVYFQENISVAVLELEAVLLRKEIAEKLKKGEEIPPESEPARPPKPGEQVELPGVREGQTPISTGIHALSLRVKVPWDRMADFLRGVIMPLKSDGADLQVEIMVQARSETRGIKQSTLDQKVQETLNQIGAQILEESKE